MQPFSQSFKGANCATALLTTFSDRVTSSRFLWQIFDENVDEDSCSVCSHCKEQNKGGRQQQQQNETAKREERREMYEMM